MRLTYALLACADEEGRLYNTVESRARRIAFHPSIAGSFFWDACDGFGKDYELLGEGERDATGVWFHRIRGFDSIDGEIKESAAQFAHEREVDAASDERCYLETPFALKDAFREIGFKWDADVRKWWYPCKPDEMYHDILDLFPLVNPQPEKSAWGDSFSKQSKTVALSRLGKELAGAVDTLATLHVALDTAEEKLARVRAALEKAEEQLTQARAAA